MAFRFLWKTVAMVEKHRMAFLAVSCTGLFGANLTFHLFPDQTFRPLYQAWSKGEPAEVSEHFQNLLRGTLREIQLKSVNCYRAFVSFSFHPVSAGLPHFPAGCVIGIPIGFSAADLDEHGIFSDVAVIAKKEVDWRSVEGLALKEALMLSPEAQRFAIAREVIYLQNYSPLVCAAVAPLWFAGTYVTGVAVKQLLGLYSGPRLIRGLYNVAVVAVGFLGYCLSYDTVSKALDYQADRSTAIVSASFARGGVEFYDKVLSRNKILRTLMGKRGEEIYTPSGNLFPRHWFRMQPAPYTSRRDLIINILSVPQA